ncbi:MAG: hypothetical protein LBQ86_08620 [Holophagales bacterium]|nr:hypothetical protein [Holophagales bacterium]
MSKSLQTTLLRIAGSLAACTCCLVIMAQRHPGHAPPPTPLPAPPLAQMPPARINPAPPRPFGPAESGRRDNQPRQPGYSESNRRDNRGRTSESDKQNNRGERKTRRAERFRERQFDKPAYPRPLPRRLVFPTHSYWETRYFSIFDDIGRLRLKGFIPVTAVSSGIYEITDYAAKKYAGRQAGWKGYGFIVPPGESLTVDLHHSNRAWFRLIICDKWGSAVPGGLSSLHPHRPPRLTYKNPSIKTQIVYFIVDDPGWWSYEGNPYTLEITRSWNPDLFPEDLSQIVAGIWGLEQSINAMFRGPMVVMPGFK